MRTKPAQSVLLLITLLFACTSIPVQAATPTPVPFPPQSILVESQSLKIDSQGVRHRIAAPEAFLALTAAQAATPDDFDITFTGDWPEEAKNAFNYAASIWSSLIDPAVKITINAKSDATCFMCGGYSYIILEYSPDWKVPRPETIYPPSLINQFAGYDVKPDQYDFEIRYSSNAYDWYYGTDGNTPGNQVDFVTVILHEIGHGLGFLDSYMDGKDINHNDSGSWGSLYNYPLIYDTFIVNSAGQHLIDTSLFPDPSNELGVQLRSDLYFDGPHTRALNQNQPAKVEAFTDVHGDMPLTVCHLNEDFYGGAPNALMTTTLNPGEAIHSPGPVALGILADLGWTLSPNVPVFYPIPAQMMLANTQRTNAIDLWEYIPAGQSPGTNFTYEMTNSPAPEAGVSLHDNRYIDLAPSPGWTGRTLVTVQATNLDGLTATETFDVLVVSEIHPIFLPAIIRD